MLTDKLRESLIQSSKKIAIEIASLTKGKQEVEHQLNEMNNQITMTEAKIEVHRERRDEIHRILQAKKSEKNQYFSKRDQLIEEKRALQNELRGTPSDMDATDIKNKISSLSDQIGVVIETSKALSEEMQSLYEESQVEHQSMLDTIEKSKRLNQETDRSILHYRRKIAEIDGELNRLRGKMSQINEKLDE